MKTSELPTITIQINGKPSTIKPLDLWYVNGHAKATYICPYSGNRITQVVSV